MKEKFHTIESGMGVAMVVQWSDAGWFVLSRIVTWEFDVCMCWFYVWMTSSQKKRERKKKQHEKIGFAEKELMTIEDMNFWYLMIDQASFVLLHNKNKKKILELIYFVWYVIADSGLTFLTSNSWKNVVPVALHCFLLTTSSVTKDTCL